MPVDMTKCCQTVHELWDVIMQLRLPILMQAIEELPGQESPEIFGLHPNADLTFRTLQVQAAVQIIMDTQPKGTGGGGGLSREEIVDRICEDLLSKVSLVMLVACATHCKWHYHTVLTPKSDVT